MGLLMLSTLLDYLYGFWVASQNRKKAKLFLYLSIFNNLGILGVFKYYNFFALQFQIGFEYLGLHTHPVLLNVALPVGISFYTFHGMSYVFDIYRGKQKPVNSFIDYAVFVCFFPLLVAGPIERATHLLPQIQKERKFNYNQAVEGIRLILYGMFKKVVIADSMAGIFDEIFQNYQHHNGVTLIIGTIAFSFQIYGDFSGYSDMASGIAKLLGFELLSNFKFPYFSRDLAEFWRRWHISLSSWFRDYLYIPLGGSKNGKYKAVRNTFIIFLVSGLWHGASWHFLAWGFYHACGLFPLLLFNRNRKHVTDVVAQNRLLPNLKELWQMSTTFIFVAIGWIFFKVDSLTEVIKILAYSYQNICKNPMQLFDIYLFYKYFHTIWIFIICILLIDWRLRKNENKIALSKFYIINYSIYFLIIFSILFFHDVSHKYIYFEF